MRHVSKFLLIVCAVPGVGFAQVSTNYVPSVKAPSFRAQQRAGDNYQSRVRQDGLFPIAIERPSTECLDNKKTGRTVCLKRHEWEEVAAGKRDVNGLRKDR